MHPQTSTDPSPCLTVPFIFFGLSLSPFLRHTFTFPSDWNTLNLLSSVKRMVFQNAWALSTCNRAYSNQSKRFLGDIKGFLAATRPFSPLVRSVLLTVSSLTTVPDWFPNPPFSLGTLIRGFSSIFLTICRSSLRYFFRAACSFLVCYKSILSVPRYDGLDSRQWSIHQIGDVPVALPLAICPNNDGSFFYGCFFTLASHFSLIVFTDQKWRVQMMCLMEENKSAITGYS